MKTCISCGMPMEDESDFAQNDITKDYCVHCAAKDGSMKTFEDAKKSMIDFIIKTQGLEKHIAEEVAINAMKKLPAWENRFED